MNGTIHGRMGAVVFDSGLKDFTVSTDDDLIILDMSIGTGNLEFELPLPLARKLAESLSEKIKRLGEE